MFTSIKPRFPSLINGHTCTLVCLYLDQTQNKVPVRETYWVQHSSDSVFTVWTVWYGPGFSLEQPRSFCSSFSLSVPRIILPVPSSWIQNDKLPGWYCCWMDWFRIMLSVAQDSSPYPILCWFWANRMASGLSKL